MVLEEAWTKGVSVVMRPYGQKGYRHYKYQSEILYFIRNIAALTHKVAPTIFRKYCKLRIERCSVTFTRHSLTNVRLLKPKQKVRSMIVKGVSVV